MIERLYRHSLQKNVLGEILYNEPWEWVVYYPNGHKLTVRDIIKAVMMKTGCTVLHLNNDEHVVLTPSYSYIYQHVQKVAKKP